MSTPLQGVVDGITTRGTSGMAYAHGGHVGEEDAHEEMD